MKRLVRELDPTRLVTEAMNNDPNWGKGLSAVVDVQGFNYGHAKQIDDFPRAVSPSNSRWAPKSRARYPRAEFMQTTRSRVM
jgi:hypothetical protein